MSGCKPIIENEQHTLFAVVKLAKNLQMCEKMS